MDEKLLTIGQAAEYLGVSLNTLRRWDESGKLVAIKKMAAPIDIIMRRIWRFLLAI